MCPRGEGPGSVDRGQEATGGAVEGEASILPGRALTESRQPLHVAPDGAGIRLVLFRQRVRLGGVLMRQFQSTRSSVPIASVLNSPVSMGRSSIRACRARAAS